MSKINIKIEIYNEIPILVKVWNGFINFLCAILDFLNENLTPLLVGTIVIMAISFIFSLSDIVGWGTLISFYTLILGRYIYVVFT